MSCTTSLRQYKNYEPIDYCVTIHYLVGEVIDKTEKEKYNLFWEIEGFQEAVFHPVVGGGYEVEIITETCRMKAVNRDSNAIMILRDYNSTYDATYEGRLAFMSRWDIIDFDGMGFPVTKDEVEKYSLKLGCAGPTTCVLGGAGYFVGMYFLLRFAAMSTISPFSEPSIAAALLLFGGMILGIAGAFLLFRPMSRIKNPSINDPLWQIKSARQPCIIETYE